jgi:LPXTG-motif cell wall-anchored protein
VYRDRALVGLGTLLASGAALYLSRRRILTV